MTVIFYTTTNILAGPLLLFLSLIDFFLCLAVVRLLLDRLRASWATRLCMSLAPFTDSIPSAVSRSLNRHRRRHVPAWWSWALVLLVGIVLRYLLIWIIVATSNS